MRLLLTWSSLREGAEGSHYRDRYLVGDVEEIRARLAEMQRENARDFAAWRDVDHPWQRPHCDFTIDGVTSCARADDMLAEGRAAFDAELDEEDHRGKAAIARAVAERVARERKQLATHPA